MANIHLHPQVHHVIVRKTQSFPPNSDVAATDELRTFEGIAGKLMFLDRIDICCEGSNANSIPVECLTTILQKVQGLKALRLESVRLSGRHEEVYVELIKALKQSSLEEIHLNNCLPSRETEMIQMMADALARLPTLRCFEMAETRIYDEGTWTGRALESICASPTLEVLRIQGPHFIKDGHVQMMVNRLKFSQTLKELSLLCDIGKESMSAICGFLRRNSTLQILSLNRIKYGQQAPEIAQALVNNRTLRSLHLYFHYGTVRGICSSFQQLLERNCTLEKVAGGWACSHIDLFLKLNQAGRASLLEGSGKASAKEWIDVMAERQHCVSSLFYLLSQNPSLCNAQY